MLVKNFYFINSWGLGTLAKHTHIDHNHKARALQGIERKAPSWQGMLFKTHLELPIHINMAWDLLVKH